MNAAPMIYRITKPLLLFVMILLLNSCAITKHKNLLYGATAAKVHPAPSLNVFTAAKPTDSLQPVLVFVYGGNWNSGTKETYNLAARNFARHGVTVVVPDYTKSPQANYQVMTTQIAQAIKWTRDSISTYGGDPDRIYLTGHSAGGHLAALATMDPSYGIEPLTVKGIILNDAAGLDMFSYLKKVPPTTTDDYLTTWTNDPASWKTASPYYYINTQTPELLIYVGEKTYPSIAAGNKRFLERLQEVQPQAKINYLNKKHAAMVVQFFYPWNKRIDEIVRFMNTAR